MGQAGGPQAGSPSEPDFVLKGGMERVTSYSWGTEQQSLAPFPFLDPTGDVHLDLVLFSLRSRGGGFRGTERLRLTLMQSWCLHMSL